MPSGQRGEGKPTGGERRVATRQQGKTSRRHERRRRHEGGIQLKRDKERDGGGVMQKVYGAFDGGKRLLGNYSPLGEGPAPLRALCFVGGLAMTVLGIIGVANVHGFVSAPPSYALQAFESIFGVGCMIIEAKDFRCFDNCKPWVSEWFAFLTVPGGKGAFYVFMGILGLSLWKDNMFIAVGGAYMIVMGCICFLAHCGMTKELRDAGIEVTRPGMRSPIRKENAHRNRPRNDETQYHRYHQPVGHNFQYANMEDEDDLESGVAEYLNPGAEGMIHQTAATAGSTRIELPDFGHRTLATAGDSVRGLESTSPPPGKSRFPYRLHEDDDGLNFGGTTASDEESLGAYLKRKFEHP